MATVVGAVAGSFIPIPGAQFVLTALGSFVDQQFVLPALFPTDDIEGPRLNELRIQSAEEGAPMNFVLGPNNRVAGTIIWVSDLIEVEEREGGGGKGGGGGSRTVGYSYFVNIAIAFAGRQQISSLDKILAEGKKIWENNPADPSVTSTLIECDKIGLTITDLKSPNGGPDLSIFRSGLDIVVAGFSNSVNNGTFTCVASSFNAATGTSRVRIQNAASVDEAAGASVSLDQDFPNFVQADMKDISVYVGTEVQAPDDLIESFEGAGNVPGFRGVAYVVIEELALRNYGNRIPQLNFLCNGGAGTVSSILGTVLQRSGLSVSDYDVSDLTDLNLEGYPIHGPEATTKSLQPLLTAFDIVEQSTADGGLRFFERRNATVVDVDPGDLACHLEGEETPRDIQIEPIEAIRLPSEVNVNYLDKDIDDQKGSQRERRRIFDIDAVQTINLPLVLSNSAAEAKSIAKRVLWSAINARQRIVCQLPPKYIALQKNDVIRFTLDGLTWMLLIHKLDRGDQFILRLECSVELKSALIQPSTAESPITEDPIFFIPPSVSFEIFDIPPVHPPTTTTVPVVVVGVSVTDPDTLWGGATVLESQDDSEFDGFETMTQEAHLGFTISVLPDASPGIWDRVSTVDVDMWHGSLASRTELEVLNGLNRMIIGDEIIGFATATLIGTNQWRLSNLLRGLRDTTGEMAGHALEERVCHFNGLGLVLREINVSRLDTPFFYKAIPSGGVEDDYPSKSVTITGKSLMPFSPTGLDAEREVPSTDDVTLSWVRRSRQICKILGPDACPLEEPVEKYEVEIFAAGGSTVLRTFEVESATSVVYTAAMQTADGFTAGVTAFDWIVYMINNTVGRGGASATGEVPTGGGS